MQWQKWLQSAWHIAFPRLCLHCRKQTAAKDHHFCVVCLANYVETDYHLYEENPVAMHFFGRVPIQRATSLLDYKKGELSQTLLRQFKYESRKDIGRMLGQRLGGKLQDSAFLSDIQGIIPVPLHVRKKRLRGFNQSEVFAQGISEATQIPTRSKWIQRHAYTATQTRKSRQERMANVAEAFSFQTPKSKIPAGHYLLVDDVITTGATLEAVAQLVLQIPDSRVSLASIALG